MEVKFKCTYMYVRGGTKCKCVLHHVFMEIQCKFTNLQTSAHCGMVQIGKRDAPVVPSNWVTESNIVGPPWYFSPFRPWYDCVQTVYVCPPSTCVKGPVQCQARPPHHLRTSSPCKAMTLCNSKANLSCVRDGLALNLMSWLFSE